MDRTAKQKTASRSNGTSGGRPRKDLLRKLTGFREKARRRGASMLDAAVQHMIAVLHDSGAEPTMRMRAAENIADRFGLPRMQSIHQVDETTVVPKLYIERAFDPPDSFNPEPPAATIIDVVPGTPDDAEVNDA